MKDCPNNRVVIVTDGGEYDSASKDECDLSAEGKSDDAQEAEDGDYKSYPFEASNTIVFIKALSVSSRRKKRCSGLIYFRPKPR